jgi:1,4-alpha-glucan branching enzyme
MWAQPGKKLLFMGGEFGQRREWNHDQSLDWDMLAEPRHAGLGLWVRDLNRLYASEPALHAFDFDPRGFEWIDCHDADHSVVALERRGTGPRDRIVAVFNFTPVPRYGYLVGVDVPGEWIEVLNGDAAEYGGSGMGNRGRAVALPSPSHGRPHSLSLTLPPLAAVFLRPAEESAVAAAAAHAEADDSAREEGTASAAANPLPRAPSSGE